MGSLPAQTAGSETGQRAPEADVTPRSCLGDGLSVEMTLGSSGGGALLNKGDGMYRGYSYR